MSYQAHYFLGIPIEESVARAVSEWAEQNKDKLKFQNWVVREDYHITLIFLGAATDDQLQGISETLKGEIKASNPFSFDVTNIGFFGLKEQPRVLWAGITPLEELSVLRRRVVNACIPHGFTPEDRPYRPHITLARRWNGKEVFDLQETSFITTRLQVNVGEVILYRSHRDRTPKYEPISRFPIG